MADTVIHDPLIEAIDLLDAALKEPVPEGSHPQPVLFIYPRYLEEWARQKQRDVGAHRLRVIPFSGSLMGFRTRHIIIVKPHFETPIEEARYNQWLEESVKCRLAPGCLENLHVVG